MKRFSCLLKYFDFQTPDEAKDIVEAVGEMNTVQNALKDVLEDVDVYQSHGFRQRKRCVGTWVEHFHFQDLCSQHIHDSHVPAGKPSSYYKTIITIPL